MLTLDASKYLRAFILHSGINKFVGLYEDNLYSRDSNPGIPNPGIGDA